MNKNPTFENLMRAIDLLDAGSIDRNGISDSLGISLTSARNIADFLTGNNFASEFPKKPSSGGRKASALYLKNVPIYGVCDIYPDKINTYIFAFNLKQTHKFTYKIRDHLFLDDSYTEYFTILSNAFPDIKCLCFACDCEGVDGKFSDSFIPGLKNICLTDLVREHMGDLLLLTECRDRHIADTETGISAVISEIGGAFTTSVLYDGKLISRNQAYPFAAGDTLYFGRSLNKRIYYATNSAEYYSALADFLHMLISLVSADRIYFLSDRYHNSHEIACHAEEKLILEYGYSPDMIPELIPVEKDSPSFLHSLKLFARERYVKFIL